MAKKRISFDIDIPGRKKKGSKRKSSGKSGKTARSDKYAEYKSKLMNLVSSFLEEELGVIVDWIKDILNLKRKIRAYTFYATLLAAGFVLLLFGAAKYLDCMCATLPCGANYALVGAIAVVAALIYKRATS